jgi:hypothetical protein
LLGLSGISVSRLSPRARRRIVEGAHRRLLAVVERQEVEEPAHLEQRLDVVLEGAVGDDRRLVWVDGAAQFLGVTTSLVTVFTTSGPVTNM